MKTPPAGRSSISPEVGGGRIAAGTRSAPGVSATAKGRQSTPLVIAHRGACGYLPEHTRPAKLLAYGMGADFLEQDVVASRDGRLIVAHDLWLEETTDVALRFPSRRRGDGRFYVADFTLPELRRLRVLERRDAAGGPLRFGDRFGRDDIRFGISTLEEEIAVITELNRQTGRAVGIYPEIKSPKWHEASGFDLAGAVLDCLSRTVPADGSVPVYVQCFDPDTVRRLCADAPRQFGVVQLLETVPTDQAHLDPADVRLAVGPSIESLLDGMGKLTAFGSTLQALGLPIHCYTFRRDQLPAWAESAEQFWDALANEASVDGVFTDFPDLAITLRTSP